MIVYFEEKTGREAGKGIDQDHRYTRTFVVRTSDPLDGPYQVRTFGHEGVGQLAIPGDPFAASRYRKVPALGDTYVELAPDWTLVLEDDHAACVNVTVRDSEDDPHHYTVVAEYAGVDDPTAVPAEVSGDPVAWQEYLTEAFEVDADGKPVEGADWWEGRDFGVEAAANAILEGLGPGAAVAEFTAGYAAVIGTPTPPPDADWEPAAQAAAQAGLEAAEELLLNVPDAAPAEVAEFFRAAALAAPPPADPKGKPKRVPVVNSAQDPFEQGVAADRTRTKVTVVKNVSYLDPTAAEAYRDSLNRLPYAPPGFPSPYPAGTCKLAVAFTRVRRSGYGDFYWRVRAEVDVDTRGWDAKVRDAGYRFIDPADGRKKAITLKGGVHPSTPWPLRQDAGHVGDKMPEKNPADPADPEHVPLPPPLRFGRYKWADWSGLGFLFGV